MIRRMSSPRLIGRAAELGALEACLERADQGDPTLVLVTGEAGVGKSRLLAEFVARARAKDPQPLVLSGACAPMSDAGAPYGPILVALRSLGRDEFGAGLASSAPNSGNPRAFERELGLAGGLLATSVDPVSTDLTSGIRLFESLLSLFHRLGRDRSVILVIEDLQWADRSTREIIDFLVRCLRDVRIAVVATVRTDEIGRGHALVPYLAELLRNPHVERMELRPLVPDEVGELVEAIDGESPTAERLDRIVALADGNPFYVEELAAVDGPSNVPASVREIVLGRVSTMSDPARMVLRLAAVAGRSIDHVTLAASAEMDERELGVAIDETIDRRLIDLDHDRETYRFRHGLVREVVYADLLPGDRRRLHRTIATALEAGSAGPPSRLAAEIAAHFDRAGDLAAALGSSVAAGDAAMRIHAFHEAADHYERALEITDSGYAASVGRETLVERTADAAYRAGEPHRAVELIRALVDDHRSDPRPQARTADLYGRLAAYLHDDGDETGAFAASRLAVALLDSEPDVLVRARVLATHGRILMLSSDATEAEIVCTQAVEIARVAGSSSDEASALISRGVAVAGLGRNQDGLADLNAGRVIAEEAGDAQEMARAYLNIDYVHWVNGRIREALEATIAGIEALRRLGLEWTWGSRLLGSAAEKLFELGRWAEAEEMMDRAAERSRAGMSAFAMTLDRCQLPINRGDFEEADSLLRAARQLGARMIGAGNVNRLWLLTAQLELWRGRPVEARAAVGECRSHVDAEFRGTTIAMLAAFGLRSDADSAQHARDRHDMAAASDLVDDGQRMLADAEEAARVSTDGPAMNAYLELARAEHARLEERPGSDAWVRAADAFEAMGMLHRVGYARYRLAEALLVEGHQRTRASAALADAHRIATELGARPLLRDVDALAARARLVIDRDVSPIVPPVVDAPPFGLTARELEVLDLVARGRTNRQIASTLFVTEKTAGLHVSNILAKMGVANRVEAAAVAHRLGLFSQSP